jgi:hypothetical protein
MQGTLQHSLGAGPQKLLITISYACVVELNHLTIRFEQRYSPRCNREHLSILIYS